MRNYQHTLCRRQCMLLLLGYSLLLHIHLHPLEPALQLCTAMTINKRPPFWAVTTYAQQSETLASHKENGTSSHALFSSCTPVESFHHIHSIHQRHQHESSMAALPMTTLKGNPQEATPCCSALHCRAQRPSCPCRRCVATTPCCSSSS